MTRRIRYDAHGRPVLALTAQYERECVTCGETIRVGEPVEWPAGRRREVRHVECRPVDAAGGDTEAT